VNRVPVIRWETVALRIGREAGAAGANARFLSKSAEQLENKAVEICAGAKKRKRVRKGLKKKGDSHLGTEGLG